MTDDGKLLIVGAGRSGSTFLVTLLVYLDVDTGVDLTDTNLFDEETNSGFESLFNVGDPIDIELIRKGLKKFDRVIKGPAWSFILRSLVEYDLLEVTHVLLPIRRSEDVARSRMHAGLMWHAEDFDQQVSVSRMANGAVIETCVLYDIPYTPLRFPDLVNDWEYLYEKLRKVIPEIRNKRHFKIAFDKADAFHRPHAVSYPKEE